MTRFLSLAAVSLFAVPAFADGVAAPEPQPTIAAPAGQWTEFYGGLQLDFIDGDSTGAGDAEFDGTLFGIFAGYRHDFGSLVGGVEVDYVTGNGDFTPIDPAGPVFDMDYDSLLRIGAELGYDAGSFMPYATVGYVDLDFTLPTRAFADSGHFYGIGVDYRVTDRVIIGGEILQHEFSDFDVPNNDISVLVISLNVAYTF